MNKHFLLSLFFIFIQFASNAQGCPGGPILLATQAQVDAFPVNYPDCQQPNGRFVIGADPTVMPPHPKPHLYLQQPQPHFSEWSAQRHPSFGRLHDTEK
jgi:hypothetical protein